MASRDAAWKPSRRKARRAAASSSARVCSRRSCRPTRFAVTDIPSVFIYRRYVNVKHWSAQRGPGLLGGDVDGDVAAVGDRRGQDHLELDGLVAVVVGRVHDVLVDVDRVAHVQLPAL